MNETGQLLLFWDYDTGWGADRSRAPGGPKAWGPLEFTETERLLELHAEYEVPACFAVVGSAALPGDRPYHDPNQIRRIHAAGHEVGSHALRHEWLPGLRRAEVLESLKVSRENLEQCIGAAVTAFVPPYNQPFDHPPKLSISLSERRSGSPERMSLGPLCETLRDTGYRFCRVAYRSALRRVRDRFARRRVEGPVRLQRIGGLWCARLNTPGGFDAESQEMVVRVAERGGVAVVYGHPHSLHSGNSQDEKHFVPFLRLVRDLKRAGRLRVVLPRDLVAAEGAR
jgi:peptidoglycan/xylan/chitin deacetylase (PgdA/CDA1 family)